LEALMNVLDERSTATCPKCKTLNYVLTRYAGYGPANDERETAECAKPGCGATVASEKCFAIFSELSPEALEERVKRFSRGFDAD
jgi:hypothetical protein